ncbi:MAG TPA: hypothetical protein HA360_04295 [Nanoarchaeota archaeon]|nr:hypothetical protein [Candidatus Woesearchaeota archaeon]HIH58499.1 hypothetical protein [Nanoarchaeota archaeon]HII14268.1 hypothetical protein [Nanoarchaeota archaeon]HIJ05042.1 hypothetical protein [Nanoarchaeota archaeon]
MKELDIQAKKDLIEVYEKFIQEGLTKNLQQQAEKVYLTYLPSKQILHPLLYTEACGLFSLAYPGVMPVTGIFLTKDQAKEALKKIQELDLSK